MSKVDKVKQEYITPEVAVQIVENGLSQEIKNRGIKALPRGARVAIAHGLHNNDYSLHAISRTLGIDKNTAMTYVNDEVEDKFIQYTEAADRILREKAVTLESVTSDVLLSKLKDSENVEMRDAITLYKVLREGKGGVRQGATNTGNMIAINVHPSVTRDNK